MRTFTFPIILSTLIFGLAGCGDQTADKGGTPNLADATSAKTAEAVQKQVVQNGLPKADKSVPAEQYIEFNSGNQLMFSYLALAGMPLDYKEITTRYSQEYARSSDEFRKNDLLTALKPKIDAEVAAASAQRYFKVTLDNPIEKYDFEKKGFPVNSSIWESGSYRYFHDNNEYKLGFTNGDSFRYLTAISEDDARKIESMRSKYNAMDVIVYGFVQSADPSSKTLKTQIVNIVLTDKKGGVLATQ